MNKHIATVLSRSFLFQRPLEDNALIPRALEHLLGYCYVLLDMNSLARLSIQEFYSADILRINYEILEKFFSLTIPITQRIALSILLHFAVGNMIWIFNNSLDLPILEGLR